MLKIENLCKSFRTEDVETIALNNVSFTVEDGEFVARLALQQDSCSHRFPWL